MDASANSRKRRRATCAPSLELQAINAPAAARRALVITQPSKFPWPAPVSSSCVSKAQPSTATSSLRSPVIANGSGNTFSRRAWIGDLIAVSPGRAFEPYLPYWSVIQDGSKSRSGRVAQ